MYCKYHIHFYLLINREAAKISASSSSKIDKHKYLTGEKILLPDQKKVAELAKLT